MTFADRRAAKIIADIQARRSLTDLTAYSLQLLSREPDIALRDDVIRATDDKVKALHRAAQPMWGG